jgi:GTPase KRas
LSYFGSFRSLCLKIEHFSELMGEKQVWGRGKVTKNNHTYTMSTVTQAKRSDSTQAKYNLAVVGGGAVGKSALTIQFIQHVFCDEYDPTIEDQHRKQTVVDEECCLLEILDTAGQEEYIAMRDQYLRSAEGFLICFSLCARTSFLEATQLYESILRAKDAEHVPVVFVGNKSDLVSERQITQEEITSFIRSTGDKNMRYIECSAKTRTNVDEAFHTLVRSVRQSKIDQQKKLRKDSKKKSRMHPTCPLL